MTTVDVDGVRLATEVIGSGKPVTVVAHGLTGSRQQLAVFAPFLPGTKVLFDFRGHGESDRPGPGSYSMDHFASDVDAVATAFGATCVVGSSLGGGATLRLVCSKPDRFEKIVILLPARLKDSRAGEKLLRIAELLETKPLEEAAELILADEDADGSFDGFVSSRDLRREAILQMNRDGVPLAIRECIGDPPIRDRDALRAVQAPVLVIGQEGDPVHDASLSRDLAAALPRAELMLFSSQQALIEAIPELTIRVATFLAS
ncbi:MAG: alpha/beta fold hydrolase [Actinomycetota bacterium]